MSTDGSGRKGFGSLSPERRRQVASAGGKAAQKKGTAHRFSHDEAVAAGRKGGLVPRVRTKAPPPGSDEAVAAGCTCPVLDNNHGRGYFAGGPGTYAIMAGCPLHDQK